MTLTVIRPQQDQVTEMVESKNLHLFHAGAGPWKQHVAVSAITKAANAVVSISSGHGIIVGETVRLQQVEGMSQINDIDAVVTLSNATDITINIDSSGFSNYTSGGVVEVDKDYVAETSIANKVKNAITGYKRVLGTEMMPVVPRVDWLSSSIFSGYSPDDSSAATNIYTTTENGSRLYICASPGPGISSYEPNHTSTASPLAYPDGYSWLFVGEIDSDDLAKFGTADWTPIRPDQTVSSDKGQLVGLNVISPGTGYSHLTTISLFGDGSDAQAIVNVFDANLGISSAKVSNPGSDYTWAEVVVDGTGTGAEIKPVISFGFRGANLVELLNVKHVRFSVDHDGDEGGYLYIGAERSIGLLRSEVHSDLTDLRTKIYIDEDGKLFSDDVVTGRISQTKAVVTGKATDHIKVTDIVGPGFIDGEIVVSKNNMTAVIQSVEAPTTDVDDTSIMIVNNYASPVVRNDNQLDTYEFTVGFNA